MRTLLLFAAAALVVACPTSSSSPPPEAPKPAASPTLVGPSETPVPVASSNDAPTVEPPSGAVKSPIFSDDDCASDADCAPLATCHPDKCVAAAKAGTMPPGTMCTMDCRGGTLDCNFNHCGCAANPSGKKKCAVLPGPK